MSTKPIQITITNNNKTYSIDKPTRLIDLLESISYTTEPILKPIVCSINNKLFDLATLLEQTCTVTLLSYEDEQGLEVFKHSSAHVLGKAIMDTYPGSRISSGPPTENGFYYDVALPEGVVFNESCYKAVLKNMLKIMKKKIPFEPVTYKKDELLNIFRDNKYKLHYINRMGGSESTIYKLGNFEDFCRGPHIPDASYIAEMSITHHGSSYFLGEASNDTLTRIYGISFPIKGMLAEYKERVELAKKRNHKVVGKELNLFLFSEMSPGSCFFLPKGTFIYNKLADLMRSEYRKRGFKEVITPNIFSTKIWEISGHLQNYKENMFLIGNSKEQTNEEGESALKPMNCPGHCLMFSMQSVSYRNLPLRYADFGVLHRNELSGTLTGLTRVRRFCQDDAHIFCARSQITSEITNYLEFLSDIFKIFEFKYELHLSTRPEKYMGTIEEWDSAENQLKDALKKYNYKLNEADGAFYGPKIDILLKDSLGKRHQCATIQLDFQLPKNFNLTFINNKGEKEGIVMIHRAILGSLERFIAILIDNFGKELPFWVSPNQIAIVNFSASEQYISKIAEELSEFEVKVFGGEEKAAKQIRTAKSQGYRVVIVVGKIEEEKNVVKVYQKDCEYTIDELKGLMRKSVTEKSINIF